MTKVPATFEKNGLNYLSNSMVTVSRFITGDDRFNSFDNLAFQPETGILYVIEDHDFGEVWACLPDGSDRDLMTDGCVSILSIIDPEAEPTGFTFGPSGDVAYLAIQHGEQPESLLDRESNKINGETDDIIMITGFKSIAATATKGTSP